MAQRTMAGPLLAGLSGLPLLARTSSEAPPAPMPESIVAASYLRKATAQ